MNQTDLGNAMMFAKVNAGKLRYVPQWKTWARWDGRRWMIDSGGKSPHDAAKATLKALVDEANSLSNAAKRVDLIRWALESESKKRITAMIQLAQCEDPLCVDADRFDRDQWLLNVRNGTIDLRTGQLLPHRPGDLITKLADVDFDPTATCPRWDRFLLEIMDGDPEMAGYLMRIIGHALTGDVSEHCLFFFWGGGRNGKSLLLKTVQAILGDYAATVNASLLTSKHQDDHPTGLADLEGRRLVATIEVADGKRMAEALVKQLTGGDRIKARRMRQDFREFEPTHKLVMAANHKPEIRGADEGIWQRIKLVPFPVTFVGPDKVDPDRKRFLIDRSLDQSLKEEHAGILASAVRSCLEWQSAGLEVPAKVGEATNSYRLESDEVSAFIRDRCTVLLLDAPKSPNRAEVGLLYSTYRSWCQETGGASMSSRNLAARLDQLGHKIAKSNGRAYRSGLRLLSGLTDSQNAALAASESASHSVTDVAAQVTAVNSLRV